MEHCPGKDNVAADVQVLSRQHPEKNWEKKEKDTTQIYINALKYKCSKELENNLKNVQQFQREDTRVNQTIQSLDEGEKLTSRFKMNKGILYRKTTQGEERIYLPINTIKMLIWKCRIAYGHTGADKNHKIIKDYFY